MGRKAREDFLGVEEVLSLCIDSSYASPRERLDTLDASRNGLGGVLMQDDDVIA